MSEYFFLIDYIEAFIWAVAYMLIAMVGFSNKDDQRLAIPKFSLLANFAWEVASIFEFEGSYRNHGSFGRFLWLVFDILIVISVYIKYKNSPDFRKKSILWGTSWLALTLVFYFGFKTHELFMPFSAFAIDIEMAILFYVQRKKLDPSLRLHIGLTKLVGDVLAGLYCSIAINPYIAIIATGSFIFNVLYVIYAVKELKSNPEVNDNFKNNFKLFIKNLNRRPKKDIQHQKNRQKKNNRKTKTHRSKK